ncbi:ParB/RepB/Spo0J family partition protein [Sphingomonas sp. ABOLF]|uniref:ParB/RepB/Spo0J family partition protein n=1 Tax=Sphingomonas sp. ABOLF TaxID=1985879 RepID=UPI000F7D784B|nr:ParB/RepB/Spo0J family partition protein [Sphingomonas sp. ABOLF]RSV15168.1 ParB/RepB/Spo0J family partition protein [Sphingomonas sp. ABOLF]
MSPAATTRTALTIDQLCLSPFNVRTNKVDVLPQPAMERSILALGLIQPLRVHPLRGNKAKFGVHAGGRRYRCIKALIDRGDLPRDWSIDVLVRDGATDAQLYEESTAENMLRRELRDYEVYQGVARAHRRGDSAETIARNLGQEITWVRQAIRLGNLAEPIFKALEAGQISVEDAKAYGATEDQALQLSTFQELSPLPSWQREPAKIRAHMRVGDREANVTLRFVGVEAYRAAGGRFELDIFAESEEERGRVVDQGVLRELRDGKLAGLRDELRRRTGRDLRFVPRPPQTDFGTDHTLQVTPKPGDADAIVLPEGEIVAWISIGDAGEPEVTYWWESRSAKHGTAKPEKRPERAAAFAGGFRPGVAINDAAAPGAKREADRAIKEEAGVSQGSIEILRNLRRQILRAMLLDTAREGNPFGRDYLVWAQLRLLLGRESSTTVGMRPVAIENCAALDLGRDLVRSTPAQAKWDRAIAELQGHASLADQDLVAAFRAYQLLSEPVKNLAAAVVAGAALERSLNAPGYDVPVHSAIADRIGADDAALRSYWTPDEAFLELLPIRDRLAIAEPFVENAAFARWATLKGTEVTRSVLSVVTGSAAWLRQSTKELATRWVHPLLQFSGASTDDQAKEAQ